jgi:hypothetical protein
MYLEAHFANESSLPQGIILAFVNSLGRDDAIFLLITSFRKKRGCGLPLQAARVCMHYLFDETEEDGNDDDGLESLTKDNEENWDGKDVTRHGRRSRGDGRSLGKAS